MAAARGGVGVRVDLLGTFTVATTAGASVRADAWPTRRAGELVQLLALADGHRLLREQVIEALWPHLDPGAGAANLRKAAHHARQVLGDPEAVVLRGGQVSLFPSATVSTDVGEFETAARSALAGGDPRACAEVAARWTGDLLPDARYAEWAAARRDELRDRHRELLRAGGCWEQLAAADPTDEAAHRELMRAAIADGNPHAAVRWYGRLRTALEHELGVRPGHATDALYDRCVAGLRAADRTAPDALVGRDEALARLRAAVVAAEDGELTALALRGPGGIGKSTLCRALTAAAEERGWTTVAVRAAPDSGPYAPLGQVVEVLLARDPALVAQLPATTRTTLSALAGLAGLAGPASGEQAADGPLTRHQIIGALRRLLLAAGDGGDVLLLVDDVHTADDATVESLLHLAGVTAGATAGVAGPRTGRLLVACAYRPESVPDVLARGVARLDRAGVLAGIDLAPLARDDAAALAGAAAPAGTPGDVLDRIVDVAGGNPFFLLELARSAELGPGLPPTVRDAVAARFVDLDEGTRSMLQRLAVAGDDLDTARVLALTGLDEDEGFALLDAALAADVLAVHGAGYRFRHDLVRQALVDQMPPHRRIAVHRDAARRLSSTGGTPDAVAAHWLAGERPAEAAPWLVTAARNAARLGAFGDAQRHADTVLRHLPEHPAALYLRAEALEALGDERAPAAFAAAARVAQGADRDEIRAKQALASVRAGDPGAAVTVLADVHATSLDGQLAQSLALAGAAAMGFADPTEGVEMGARTRQLAVEAGNPAAVVIASWAEAAAAHAKGDLPRSLRAVLHDTQALPELAITVFDGQLCVAERLLYGREPYTDVIAFADALAAEAGRLGAARGEAFATTFRGEAHLLTGHLDAAQADLTRGVDLHRSINAAGGEALSLQRLAEVHLYRGEGDEARRLLDEALAVARDSNLGFHLFDRIYGAKIAAAPDPSSAMAALEEAEDAVHGSMETCPGCRIALAVPAAIAAAHNGDLERAARYEAAADRLTSILMRLPGWYAALDEVRGHRARSAGDHAAAAAHFCAAAEGFAAAGQPLDAQRCRAAASAPPSGPLPAALPATVPGA